MSKLWHTAWQGTDIVLFRGDTEVDRLPSHQIERVIFVHRGAGLAPGDLLYAVIEMAEDHVLLPAETGISGRVNFERQNLWAEKQCVFWASEQKVTLPSKLRRGLWLLRPAPAYTRLPRAELAPRIEQWAIAGPQTWEQRKWMRIASSRPFAGLSPITQPGELTEVPPPRKRA